VNIKTFDKWFVKRIGNVAFYTILLIGICLSAGYLVQSIAYCPYHIICFYWAKAIFDILLILSPIIAMIGIIYIYGTSDMPILNINKIMPIKSVWSPDAFVTIIEPQSELKISEAEKHITPSVDELMEGFSDKLSENDGEVPLVVPYGDENINIVEEKYNKVEVDESKHNDTR